MENKLLLIKTVVQPAPTAQLIVCIMSNIVTKLNKAKFNRKQLPLFLTMVTVWTKDTILITKILVQISHN